jgi:thiamine biosynthesis lipoprotein
MRLALALLVATTSVAAAAPDPDRKFVYTGQAMGTVVTVFFWTDDEAKAAKAAEAVFAEMKRIDGVMTTWTETSEVSKINAAAGVKPVAVSEETFEVIARAQDVARRTRGLFDITVGAFKGLWKFDQDMDGTLPDPAEVKKRLALVGYKHLVLNKPKRTVFLKKKGMSITLGGIAKGYAVDKCVKLLFEQGFTSFMVQAGGDMFISGKKGEAPWVVGIRDPRGAAKDAMFATAPVEDRSFSTSGDYERGFVKDGKRYHHILDPRTGQPATASRSVTVRAKDAFTADAWSKVLFILGPTEAMKLMKREKLDFDVLWVDAKNEVTMTPGLKSVVTQLKPPTAGI